MCQGNHFQRDCPQGAGGKGGYGGGYGGKGYGGKGKGLHALYPQEDQGSWSWQLEQAKPFCRLKPEFIEAVTKTARRFQEEEEEEDKIWKEYAQMVEVEKKQMQEDEDRMKDKTCDVVDEEPWTKVGQCGKSMRVLMAEASSGLSELRQDGGWKKVKFTVDSGAGETVMSRDDLPGIDVKESEGSRRDQHYLTANNARIPNEGEKKLLAFISGTWKQGNNGWQEMVPEGKSVTTQVAAVTQPLMSVKRLCQAGHRVVFGETGSFVEDKGTGEVMEIREEAGEYMLEMWVEEKTVFPGQWR